MAEKLLPRNLAALAADKVAWGKLRRHSIPRALVTKTDFEKLLKSIPAWEWQTSTVRNLFRFKDITSFVKKKEDVAEVVDAVKQWTNLCALLRCDEGWFPDGHDAVSAVCVSCRGPTCLLLDGKADLSCDRQTLEALLDLRLWFIEQVRWNDNVLLREMHSSIELLRKEGDLGEFVAVILERTFHEWGLLKKEDTLLIKSMLDDGDTDAKQQAAEESWWIRLRIALARLRVISTRDRSSTGDCRNGMDIPFTAESAYVYGMFRQLLEKTIQIKLHQPKLFKLLSQTGFFELDGTTKNAGGLTLVLTKGQRIVEHLAFRTKLHIKGTQSDVKTWLKGGKWKSWRYFGFGANEWKELTNETATEHSPRKVNRKRKSEDNGSTV